MIKVALIIERANIQLGGAERSIIELTETLAEMGIDVTLLAASGSSESVNIKVLCDNAGKRTSLTQFAAAIKDHLNTYDYDIVHSTLPLDFADIYQPRGGAYPEAIDRNAVSYNNPAHTLLKRAAHFLNFRRTELLIAEKLLCSKKNGPIVAALSNYVCRQFAWSYKLPESRIALIPNAVKPPLPIPQDELDRANTSIRTELNIDTDTPATVYLFAANNFRLKGLDTLLHALKIVHTTYSKKRICLAIAGNDSNINYYEKLALNLGIIGQVVFLRSLKSIYPALSVCNAAVLPTYYDPCSRFILEALAAQKPVITSKFNGASDFYKDDVHGKILDKPNDKHALAEALIFYSQKNNAQSAVNAIINDKLIDNIVITRHCRQLIELYDKIIESKQKK